VGVEVRVRWCGWARASIRLDDRYAWEGGDHVVRGQSYTAHLHDVLALTSCLCATHLLFHPFGRCVCVCTAAILRACVNDKQAERGWSKRVMVREVEEGRA
jgi:hypothetical protein